jgi:hypothetical protein
MIELLSKDVYLGRGPGCYKQPGNKTYRDVVKLYAADFRRDVKKSEKGKFIDSLQSKLKLQGFRFFSYSVEEKKWVTASKQDVKEKVAHDLRDTRKALLNEERKTRVATKSPQALVTKGKPNYIKKDRSIRTKGMEQTSMFGPPQMVQNNYIQGYNQIIHTDQHLHHDHVKDRVISGTGLIQICGFWYHLVPTTLPIGSYIGNQDTRQLPLPQDNNFEKDIFDANNGVYSYENSTNEMIDDGDNSFGTLQDPLLESAADDILELEGM